MTSDRRSRRSFRPHLGLSRSQGGAPRGLPWFLLVALGIAVFVLGLVGFLQAPTSDPRDHRSFSDALYQTLQLFVLKSGNDTPSVPLALDIARFLAPAVALSAALVAAYAVFREQVSASRVRLWSSHTVVCGLGEMGLLLARSFRRRGERVVAVERDESNPNIEVCRAEGVPVVVGDATAAPVLRAARVDRARYLVGVCGRDDVNAELPERARELPRHRVLTAAIHLVNPELCDLLAEGQLSHGRSDQVRLEFFNVFERGAQAWLAEHPPFRSGRRQLVVVGLGYLGRALAVGAARAWLAANPEHRDLPRLVLVDRVARQKARLLRSRYPQLNDVCELVSLQIEIESEAFEEAVFLDPAPSAVYITVGHDSQGLAAGLTLAQHLRGKDVPIVIRTSHGNALRGLAGGFEQIHPFALLERTCTADNLLGGTRNEILARAIHEEYVRKQQAEGESPATNPSMVSWETLPESLRESNRRQSDHIPAKLGAIGCALARRVDWSAPLLELTPEEVELLAWMEHDRWRAERVVEGWSYSQGAKDASRRTTPWLIP